MQEFNRQIIAIFDNSHVSSETYPSQRVYLSHKIPETSPTMMIAHRLHILLYISALLFTGCSSDSPFPPTVDICTYKASGKAQEKFEGIRFYVASNVILELNLNDSRFSHLRENLNAFINDAEEVYLHSQGEGFLSPWDLAEEPHEIAICYSKSGKKKHLRYTPELYLGYYPPPTYKDGAIQFETPRTIDMNCFLRPEEAQCIKNAFNNHHYNKNAQLTE